MVRRLHLSALSMVHCGVAPSSHHHCLHREQIKRRRSITRSLLCMLVRSLSIIECVCSPPVYAIVRTFCVLIAGTHSASSRSVLNIASEERACSISEFARVCKRTQLRGEELVIEPAIPVAVETCAPLVAHRVPPPVRGLRHSARREHISNQRQVVSHTHQFGPHLLEAFLGDPGVTAFREPAIRTAL